MTPPSSHRNTACVDVLRRLVESLGEQAPRLNEELPFPQRMAITDIMLVDILEERSDCCSAVLSLRAGGVSRSYRLTVDCVNGRFRLTISDESDFNQQLLLGPEPGKPLGSRDPRRLYETIATDIAGHFGTDS